MELIKKCDKLVVIKRLSTGKILDVGDVITIENIYEDGDILVSKVGLCEPFIITHPILKKYFKKQPKKWTKWIKINANNIMFRTNKVDRVEVKDCVTGLKGRAKLNPRDKFNLDIGIEVAYTKMKIKILKKHLEKF